LGYAAVSAGIVRFGGHYRVLARAVFILARIIDRARIAGGITDE
jgi:hypothetical protein